MKRVFAILTAFILLASGIQVSIDRHYCGGELASVKFSLTGKLASCGMENKENSCSHQTVVDKRCCDDQVSFYSLSSKFIPEYFGISHITTGKDITSAPLYKALLSVSDVSDNNSWVLPPGINLRSVLSLPEMCVFRI